MRPSLDQWGLALAQIIAQRGTCLRRQVGCILVNHRGHILSTGYNGKASGQLHCNEELVTATTKSQGPYYITETLYPYACAGAKAPSGEGLDACQAIHAEANAIIQCHNVWDIYTCYTTTSPCLWCVRLLLNTSCTRIVFMEAYSHPQAREEWQLQLASGEPRTWEHHPRD